MEGIYNNCNIARYCFFIWFIQSIFTCMFIFDIISLNKKIILINKIIEHNWINRPYDDIKYIDLHSPFDFFIQVFSYLVIDIDDY